MCSARCMLGSSGSSRWKGGRTSPHLNWHAAVSMMARAADRRDEAVSRVSLMWECL